MTDKVIRAALLGYGMFGADVVVGTLWDLVRNGIAPYLDRIGLDDYAAKYGDVRFELVAVGTRWGAGSCNLRHDDTGPAPLGVLLQLAGDSPAERLPPAFVSHYGWD